MGSTGLIIQPDILYNLSDNLTNRKFAVTLDHRLKRPARLADGIVSDIVADIGEGRRSPGQKLLTEAEMAARYGVSRAVVREAIAQLKADGMVSVRQGAGAYVADQPGAASFKIAPATASEEQKLRHLFELRLVVEGASAALAAVRREAADLLAIESCLKRMRSAIELRQDGSRDDGLFHEAIAKSSHNPELARFVGFLGNTFGDTRKPSWTAEGLTAGLPQRAAAEHEAILRAIAAGDSEQARRTAEDHVRNSQSRTFGRGH
jgi:GntR family transcriptional regulator, transcriptional repressor for pyruvate dehydrogenase complex